MRAALLALAGLAAAFVVALRGGSLLAPVFPDLAVVALLALGSWGLGWAVLCRMTVGDSEAPVELRDHAFALLLGQGSLGMLGVLFALLGLYRPPVLGTALALVLPLAWWAPRRWPTATWSAEAPLRRTSIAIAGAVAATSFVASLPPVAWFDSIEYHAALPALYLMEGGFVDLPHNLFSHLPHLYEMHFGFALALDRTAPLGSLQWLAGMATLVGAVAVAERLVRGSGPLAAALLAVNYDWAWSSAVAGVDLFVAGLGLHALDRILDADEGEPAAAILACGFASAAKIHAALACAGTAAAALASGRVPGWWRRHRRQIVLAALVAGLLPAPFLVRSWLVYGSPLWPFLDGSPEIRAWRAELVWMVRYEGIDDGRLLALPGAVLRRFFTVEHGWNPLALLGLLAALPLLRRRANWPIFTYAGVALTGWVAGARLTRYALTAIPLLAALSAAGLVLAWHRLPNGMARPLAHGVLALVLGTGAAGISRDILVERDPLPVLSGRETTAAYLHRFVVPFSPHPLLLAANETLPADARVASFDDPRLFHFWRPWRAATWFDRPMLSAMLAQAARDDGSAAERLYTTLRAEDFTHVLVHPQLREFLNLRGDPIHRRMPEPQRALDDMLTLHGRLVLSAEGVLLYEIR